MRTLILGGGIAGLSLAYHLRGPSVLLEKEAQLGGLCRSFALNAIPYDIGPHIIFSKHPDILRLHTSLVATRPHRRSNRIFHGGRFVKYPFENGLSDLDEADRDACLREFLDNPYEDYPARTMEQFFLRTFGGAITRLYLRPYNEKIWKFAPSFLDTQMVERIPRPPREDVIRSAHGVETEGYTHQLHFHYPAAGGFQSLVDAYAVGAAPRCRIVRPVTLRRVTREAAGWLVATDEGTFAGDVLVNCMPVHELFRYLDAPAEVLAALSRLRYNAIHIVVVQARGDALGEHFAVYLADPTVSFHRVSKLNFLGESYRLPGGGSTLLAEVTFRPGDPALADPAPVGRRVVADLIRLGLLRAEDVRDVVVRSFPYAYVVYDLDHRANTARVLDYLSRLGIRSCGRFAEFQYLNSDQVAERARSLARELDRVPEA